MNFNLRKEKGKKVEYLYSSHVFVEIRQSRDLFQAIWIVKHFQQESVTRLCVSLEN